jgi:tRNA(adenine34) deaminase
MWEDLSIPWKVSFEEAWEAYCSGSLPIGAVLVDSDHNIISRGRN